MILLHAGLLDGRFFLWAERKADPAGLSAAATDSPAAGRPHPFAAERRQLREALIRAGLRWITPARVATAAAWLPTRHGAPLPSCPLIGEPVEGPADGETRLAPWTVPALSLGTRDLLTLLAACSERAPLAPGVAAGVDLTFWIGAMAFAASLAARQRYLPGLVEGNGRPRACWEPVFTGPDSRTLQILARGLPPACRALTREESGEPPRTDPEEAVRSFVSDALDYLVRETAAGACPPPAAGEGMATEGRARSRPPAGGRGASRGVSPHDWWLRDLTGARRPAAETAGAAAGAGDAVPGEAGRGTPLDPKELARFRDELAAWRRPIRTIMESPYRLCFRLEEPKRPGDGREGAARPAGSRGGGPEGAGPPPDAAAGPAGSGDGWSKGGPPSDTAAGTAGEERWYLRYLLQLRREPGLLLPLEEVWPARGKKAALLQSGEINAREFLFSALGQAAGIYPPIASSLETPQPAGLELDTRGAYDFLSQAAIALEQAGFGVLLPAEWTRRDGARQRGGERLRIQARVRGPRFRSPEGISIEDLVEFQWEVTLGDQALSREELERLAALKAPLVALRGKWVEVRPEELQAVLFCLQSRRQSVPLQEVVRMALSAAAPVAGAEFDGVRSTGWIAKLLKQLEGHAVFEELPAPQGFRGTLRPYQVRGFSWLQYLRQWGLGACLADDMGLGKTVQVLALLQRDREAGERRPALLVCPTSVIYNWKREAARFTPGLPVLLHHGPDRLRGRELPRRASGQAMVVTSYSLLHRDLELLQRVKWSGVILDEAQNIKNPQTRQARAARSIRSGYRFALTGTPVENHVGDLWSIMEFLNPGFLGGQAEFRRRFLVPIQVYRSSSAAGRLRRLTGPFILRRLKTDRSVISDLPEKVEMDTCCPLTREQAALYAAVLQQLEGTLGAAEGIERKGLILATLLRLKQVCNHPAHFLGERGGGTPASTFPGSARAASAGRSGKLTRLTEMLEEVLAEGDKALIFTQFAEMGRILKDHLEETFAEEVLFLHGQVPRGRRDRMVERFQEEEKPALFVLSLKAGGTGLNLARASRVFHFDRWWNPAVENQATDRAFRIGQKKKVLVHRLVCSGTLEEKIGEMIDRKRELAGQVVGEGEGWLTELSNEELKDLLALRQEAVVD